MVARLLQPADPSIDTGIRKTRRELRIQQYVIDAQSRVALPVFAEVVPEGIDALFGIFRADGVDPSLLDKAAIAGPALRLQQRIFQPGARVVDVEIGGHDVEVADERNRLPARIEA